jgi:hypothetical protein
VLLILEVNLLDGDLILRNQLLVLGLQLFVFLLECPEVVGHLLNEDALALLRLQAFEQGFQLA